MENLNQQIDKLLDIIADTILGVKSKEEAAAVSLWPIPTPQGMLYWGKEWSGKLNRVLHLIDRQDANKENVKKAVKFSSRIAHILWRVAGIKNSDLSRKEGLYTVEKLFDYLAIFRKKDLFCENEKNIIWNSKELKNNKKDLSFFSSENERAYKLLLKLEASLFLYTELLYWANHPIGHSFHGPYDSQKQKILVREYFDLRPEVWKFSNKLIFSEIEIFEVYKQKTEIGLDFFERGVRTLESFKKDLQSFALKVDNKPIEETAKTSQLLENLSKIIQEGSEFIQSLNKQQLIEKHAEYWFYALKPLCDLVEEDWHPPEEVLDNIYKRFEEINDIWENVVKKNFEKTANLSYQKQAKILKEIFDPRK